MFYEERLEGDYREARFIELARQEGTGLARVEKALQHGKVPIFAPTCKAMGLLPKTLKLFLTFSSLFLEVPQVEFTFLDIGKKGITEDCVCLDHFDKV